MLYILRIYYNTLGLLFPSLSAKQLIKIFSTPRSRVIRSKEVEVIDTARISSMKFEGQEIALFEWGSGSSYVLLCHGWESNAGSLGAYVQPLIERGFKVISYDGPAHGRSEGKQASLISFAALVKEIISRNGMPEIVIGHSLGANVIMLASYEEQLSFSKAILISPVNRLASAFEGFKAIFKIPDKIYQRMKEIVSKRANYQLDEMLFEDIAPKTPIQQALIIHDEDDQITAVNHAKEIDQTWEKSTFKPVTGSGHYKILWHENALQDAFEFIDN